MRILMMIHRLADNSPYCFYVHEQAKALREQGHDVTVISCVGTMPMMKRLRPVLAQTDKRTPKADVIDGIPVYFPRCLTLGNAGEKLLGGYPMYRAALPIARKLHDEKPFDVIHAHMLPREGHAGRLLGRALGVPVALTVHGTDVFHYFIPGQTAVEAQHRNRAKRRCADGGFEPAALARRAVSRGGKDQPRCAERRRSFACAGKRSAQAALGDFRRHAQSEKMYG